MAKSALLVGSTAEIPNPLLTTGVEHIVSLYTVIMVELCENQSLLDEQLRIIYPYLISGIKGDLKAGSECDAERTQWCRSSCIILSQLSRSTRLGTSLIAEIVMAMFQRITTASTLSDGADGGNIVKAFVVFTQLQKVTLYVFTVSGKK